MHLKLFIWGFSNVIWHENNFGEIHYALKDILIELKMKSSDNFSMKQLRTAGICICSEFRGL